MYLLDGRVQHYAWGGDRYIPELLGMAATEGIPSAEYWLGAHPGGPSRVRLGANAATGLADLIRSDPARYLGRRVLETFGELPYLLKVLDVKGMLSIQVHPTREAARAGFERENALGIPLEAPHRNFKDANHKPEVMVALGEFWLLHGFNPRMREVLSGRPSLQPLTDVLDTVGIEGLYRFVMEMPQAEVDRMLHPLATEWVPAYVAGRIDKSSPDFWAARVMASAGPDYRGLDRGIFSIYLFNILQLREGQGIFQGAGVPHAYLEGRNIELMSNSDNVLRAGLTPKHVDIPELMAHTRFEYVEPQVLEGSPIEHGFRYGCPVPDFSIDRIRLQEGERLEITAEGPEIWLQMSGSASWEGVRHLESGSGGAVLLLPGEACRVEARRACTYFRAYVP